VIWKNNVQKAIMVVLVIERYVRPIVKDITQPQCSRCYSGIIVRDKHTGTLYCKNCMREAKINEY